MAYSQILKMKRLLPFLLILFLSLFLFETTSQAFKKKNSIMEPFINVKESAEENVDSLSDLENLVLGFEDTVYCVTTNKKFLWQFPKEILTKEEASEMPISLRLTNKNKKGNFQRLEILGRNLEPVALEGILTMTVQNLVEDSLLSPFIRDLQSVVRMDLLSDYEGERLFQERYYDINGELIGSTVYDYMGDNTYIERYHDKTGLPTKLANSLGKDPFGVRVKTKLSKEGEDSIYTLLEDGVIIRNRHGGYHQQNRNYKDSKGRKWSMILNLDSNFQVIGNRFGVAGERKAYDRMGRDSLFCLIDKYENIFVPDMTYPDPMIQNVGVTKYVYNKHGQLVRQSFYNEKGQRVENGLGTHEIFATYDADHNNDTIYGNNLSKALSPIESSGVSLRLWKFNKRNHQIEEFHQFDKDRKHITGFNGASSFFNAYDSVTGEMIYQDQYIADEKTGEEIMNYLMEVKGNMKHFIYADSTSYIEEKNGPLITKYWYDKNGNPDKSLDYAKETILELRDSLNPRIINTEYYANGKIKSRYTKDESTKSTLITAYDTTGNLINAYINYVDDEGVNFRQADSNIFGIPSRSGTSGFQYYNIDIKRNLKGEIISYEGRDEFSEPDYIVNDGFVFYKRGVKESHYGRANYVDEKGEELFHNHHYLNNTLIKVISIEITDSAGYENGLKDNDIIICWGDYSPNLYGLESESSSKFKWAIGSVSGAKEPRDMTVFRIEDPVANKYGLVKIPSLKGIPSEIGFNGHVRYLTERQKERLIETIEESDDFQYPEFPEETKIDEYIYAAIPKNRVNIDGVQIEDPFVILAGYNEEKGIWDLSKQYLKEDLFSLESSNNGKYVNYQPLSNYLITYDGKEFFPINIDKENKELELVSGFIRESKFKVLKDLYLSALPELENRAPQNKSFNKKSVQGYWIVDPDSSFTHPFEGYLYFTSDGKVTGKTMSYAWSVADEGLGTPLIQSSYNIDGKWDLDNGFLFIDNESYPQREVIDVENGNPETRAKELQYYQKDYKDYRNYYNNRLYTFGDLDFGGKIISLDKKSMKIEDGYGNVISFNKKKGKPKKEKKEKPDTIFNEKDIYDIWLKQSGDIDFILNFQENKIADIKFYYSGEDIHFEDINLVLEMEFKGKWQLKDNNIRIKIMPETFDIKYDYLSKGIPVDSLAEYNKSFQKLVEAQKESFIKNVLGDDIELMIIDQNTIMGDGIELKRNQTKTSVIGEVVDGGYLSSIGLNGNFVVMQWCDWNSDTGTIQSFKEEFEKQKENPKRLALLPFNTSSDGKEVFDNPFVIDVPAGLLGFRVKDVTVPEHYFIENVIQKYKLLKE